MAKFVVFSKRVDPLEARLRVFCITHDNEDKTLEHQDHFTEVAERRDVEVLQGKSQFIEFAGNLVLVTKSDDHEFPLRVLRENRLPFSDLVDRFEAHCKPKTNLTVERHNFSTRRQNPDESIDKSMTALKNLSFKCELDKLRESLVRDIFVVGLGANNRIIKERFLQEDNLDLDRAIKIAKSIEINSYSSPGHGYGQNHNEESFQNQWVRGNNYSSQQHKMLYAIILSVKDILPSIVSRKNIRYVNVENANNQNHGQDNDNDMFVVRVINKDSQCQNSKKAWMLDLKINNSLLKCYLDTGAEANVMSFEKFKKININEDIVPTNVKLTSFSANAIPIAMQY
ncbi:unnamed protein product [Ceutorhynchus assimilis]|uniref:Ankyrin UPA domain-containing protein n=1 Tax=Ceutorhynchus assimilis TaxID=467358 RepID=A0A9N9MBU4_9CUCU|nr:unnamed protein product [Ceutorhynchus assimilis]